MPANKRRRGVGAGGMFIPSVMVGGLGYINQLFVYHWSSPSPPTPLPVGEGSERLPGGHAG